MRFFTFFIIFLLSVFSANAQTTSFNIGNATAQSLTSTNGLVAVTDGNPACDPATLGYPLTTTAFYTCSSNGAGLVGSYAYGAGGDAIYLFGQMARPTDQKFAMSGLTSAYNFADLYMNDTVTDENQFLVAVRGTGISVSVMKLLQRAGDGNLLVGTLTDNGITKLQVAGSVMSTSGVTASVGRAVKSGAAADTIAANIASTVESANTASGAFAITLAAPAVDGERRRVCFKNTTGTITWSVTAPATATFGLPATVQAGQCVEIIYNSAAGVPTNSAATTWYLY
ncbi:MAG: hypothetical protein WC426_02625 [Sulfuriferula sp.]